MINYILDIIVVIWHEKYSLQNIKNYNLMYKRRNKNFLQIYFNIILV